MGCIQNSFFHNHNQTHRTPPMNQNWTLTELRHSHPNLISQATNLLSSEGSTRQDGSVEILQSSKGPSVQELCICICIFSQICVCKQNTFLPSILCLTELSAQCFASTSVFAVYFHMYLYLYLYVYFSHICICKNCSHSCHLSSV